MATFCQHLGCLDHELRLLSDLERALWERAGGDVVAGVQAGPGPVPYAGLMAQHKAWLVSQAT